eukprot:TRINITY_DN4321_c0_g1_i1.p1 TRINITY_DN4321_c0_g1~~TRINITY_DN4321_c0_g1_i1.p1  ORF type:complete len:463 (-),score=87.38 TRINITY_DN4321_c0_g1_i1:111-1499(-)
MSEKQGFLTKEGGSVKNWKKRWCVLKGGALNYSKKQGSTSLGSISLNEIRDVKPVEYKSKRFCFFLETPERTYYMFAESDRERDSWIECIRKEKERLMGGPKPSTGTTSAGNYSQQSSGGSSYASAPASSHPHKVCLEDFELKTVIGKGSFGKVIQVKKKDTGKIYAMKVLNKKTILERNDLDHTKAEKSILQKLVHPFLVNLYYSFQSEDKLYFIMDYVNGGELFYHLQHARFFDEERVRFYIAEIVCGLEYLHGMNVLYRDLKPENILLTADGHICMTDFGISKEGLGNGDRTETFCGTPEYLAPEVLEGNGYGKAVDWWSLGTLMYEMLTGLPPFYDQDVQAMYAKIMKHKLAFPDKISPDARSLLEGLLERDPDKRLSDGATIKSHPFFRNIDWNKLVAKELTPPYIPPVKSKDDTSMIDDEFKSEDPVLSVTDTTLSNAMQQNFDGFTYEAESALAK